MTQQLADCSVLIVEDEFLILIDLQAILEDEGARITTAASVSDGLAAARGKDYAAALLDVSLPDGDVYPVADVLRQSGTPLVFHSGHAQPNDVHGRFPGAIALSKPASERVLIDAIIRATRTANGGRA